MKTTSCECICLNFLGDVFFLGSYMWEWGGLFWMKKKRKTMKVFIVLFMCLRIMKLLFSGPAHKLNWIFVCSDFFFKKIRFIFCSFSISFFFLFRIYECPCIRLFIGWGLGWMLVYVEINYRKAIDVVGIFFFNVNVDSIACAVMDFHISYWIYSIESQNLRSKEI